MASPATFLSRKTIHSLPDELITEIALIIYHTVHPMMQSSFKSGDTFDTWGFLSLMHVCRRWRELIAAEGRLWTFIDITDEKMALLTLERSKGTLLTVTAGLGGVRPSVIKPVVDAICNMPERVEDLSVTENIEGEFMTALMKMVERKPMKNLRKLHLTGPNLVHDLATFNPFLTTPSLKDLTINRLCLITPPGCFSNLIHLCLRLGPDAFSMDVFLNAFGARNPLESLYLDSTRRRGSIYAPEPTLPPTPIEFPSLQTLDIDMKRTPDFLSFFKRISNPQPISNLSISVQTGSPLSEIVPEANMTMFSFPQRRDALVEIDLAYLHEMIVTAIDVELGDSCWAKKIVWENGSDLLTPEQFLRDAARLTGSPQVKVLCLSTVYSLDSLTPLESFSQLLAAYPNLEAIEANIAEKAIIALGTLIHTLPDGHPQALCPDLAELKVKMYTTNRENCRVALENLAITVEARADGFPLQKLRIYHYSRDFKVTDEYIQRLASCRGVEELHVYTRKVGSTREPDMEVEENECDGMFVYRYA